MRIPASKRKPVALMRELMSVDNYARFDDLYNYIVKPPGSSSQKSSGSGGGSSNR